MFIMHNCDRSKVGDHRCDVRAPGLRRLARHAYKLRLQQVRKRRFLHHFIVRMMILPRQARDNHKEKLKNNAVFLQHHLRLRAVRHR
eukprot:COSAG06_NODE_2642_length_6517_cov_33.378778_3_plen_87_part_00